MLLKSNGDVIINWSVDNNADLCCSIEVVAIVDDLACEVPSVWDRFKFVLLVLVLLLEVSILGGERFLFVLKLLLGVRQIIGSK